jgi:hypothetical protein
MGAYKFSFRDELICKQSHPRGDKLWALVDAVFARLVPCEEVQYLDLSPKHGPGAVADVKSGKDKFNFPYWPSKLEGTFPASEYALPNLRLYLSDVTTIGLNPKEPPARLIAVPKSYKGPRLIASEPTAHQFLQQGLLRWLRRKSRPALRYCFDPRSQEPSRDAALLASLKMDLATVDLSSASDRLSCWTVERALSSNQSLLRALHATRTRCIIDATGSYPNLSLKLKKFGAQGAAVTFPVQTMIYAGFSIAAVLFDRGMRPTTRNVNRVAREVRVFGDDIILPKSSLLTLSLLLEVNQLKINVSKTHYEGGFRESCGMDAYRGYDVTPLYIPSFGWSTSPETAAGWVDVSNNAHSAGLWILAATMRELIPVKNRKKILVSSRDGDGLRFKTFCEGSNAESRSRWNNDIHCTEYHNLIVVPDLEVKKRGSWQDLHQYLVEAPLPSSKWEAGYLSRKSVKLMTGWVQD